MFIYMLIYVSSAKKLIKNSYFVAVGIWCGCIWVEIWGNHQRCFDCPGVQGKTFRSWNIWDFDWNVCNKCCWREERCALCEALGGYSRSGLVNTEIHKYRNTDIQIQKYRNDVDGKKSVRCVRPLGGILGVVWQKYKYRRWVKGGKR